MTTKTIALIIISFLISLTPALAGDTCPAPLTVIHGVYEWDSYGHANDFNGINHIMYYDWKHPDLSLVDSTLPGCQTFESGLTVYGFPWDAAYLSPGLQWANNNTCPTMHGCAGLDVDHYIDDTDRMVVVLFTSQPSQFGYASRMLVDSTPWFSQNSRYEFDKTIGYGQRHELMNLKAPKLVATPECGGGQCTFQLRIQTPRIDREGKTGGVYADDLSIARKLIAGYKVVATQGFTAPATGFVPTLANTLNDEPGDDNYVALTQPGLLNEVETGPITVNVSQGSGKLFVAFAPIFNFAGGCAGSPCTPAELKALDQGVGTNSLTSRLASPILPIQTRPIIQQGVITQ